MPQDRFHERVGEQCAEFLVPQTTEAITETFQFVPHEDSQARFGEQLVEIFLPQMMDKTALALQTAQQDQIHEEWSRLRISLCHRPPRKSWWAAQFVLWKRLWISVLSLCLRIAFMSESWSMLRRFLCHRTRITSTEEDVDVPMLQAMDENR